jgi:7,8-dihydropterin-6-yl-methyl-4-(beta-D-ribofuranosyl)aminobenzene 5'-phosphate synthase
LAQCSVERPRGETLVAMTYPGQHPVYAEKPLKVAEGITTTGVLRSQLYLTGAVHEQALAVNLEGKGIVLIVGCGHQTLAKILQLSKDLFDEPLYGVIGGLHYPVSPMQASGAALQTMSVPARLRGNR